MTANGAGLAVSNRIIYSKVDYMYEVNVLKGKIEGVIATMPEGRNKGYLQECLPLINDIQRLLQQTPCSTMRELLQQKLNSMVQFEGDGNIIPDRDEWFDEMERLQTAISVIDELQPVA